MNGWIDAGMHKPTKYWDVLITNGLATVTGMWDGEKWWIKAGAEPREIPKDDTVFFWMPIPSAP